MNWLLENAIAEMYGPHFLLFYGVVIVLTLWICWWGMRWQKESLLEPRGAPPKEAPAIAQSSDWPIRLAGAVVIVGLGAFKLTVALAKGRHNVGFLVILCIVAVCILVTMNPSPYGREED
jgi:hypothetical protein